jgi:hypothetical protein
MDKKIRVKFNGGREGMSEVIFYLNISILFFYLLRHLLNNSNRVFKRT